MSSVLPRHGDQPFLLRCKLAFAVCDGDALRAGLSCMGGAGMKPCHACMNVVSRNHKAAREHPDFMVDVLCSDASKFVLSSDQQVFDWCDLQRDRKRVLSSTQFKQQETLSGFAYQEQSLVQDQGLRGVLPPSRMLYDVLHTYWTAGGVAASEVAWLIPRVEKKMNISLSQLQTLAKESPWHRPGGCSGSCSPSWRANLFHEARFTDKSYRGSATDCRALLPLLGCFLECLGVATAGLDREMHSLSLLLDIRNEISKLGSQTSRSPPDTRRLGALQSAHQAAACHCYADVLRPKHHWRLHLPKQLQDVAGVWIDTEASEKKHQKYKSITNRRMEGQVDKKEWSKTVLCRMIFACLGELRAREESLQTKTVGKSWQGQLRGEILTESKKLRDRGRTWCCGDMVVEPCYGRIRNCYLDAQGKPVLVIQKYLLTHQYLFSALIRETLMDCTVRDVQQVRLASFWTHERDSVRVLL